MYRCQKCGPLVSRLFVINLAVLYNLIFVIGRAIFWQLQNLLPIGWLVLDYTSDFIYLVDTIIRCGERRKNIIVPGKIIVTRGRTRATWTRASW